VSAVDPTLGRVPRVMVPVVLEALVLRETTGGFADCQMATPDPNGPARQQLLPQPFTDLPGTRPPGVYLHWALPDALTQHAPGAGGGGTLPAIPDRWLVTRLSLAVTPDHRITRSWVLEASGATPTTTDLENWTESGVLPTPGREPTALGNGDLSWAAYYDNVVNRLGFYDPLDDGAVGPLGYLVCGWYADPRLDPLADPSIASLSDFYARMASLNWSLPGGELEEDVPASALATPSAVARAAVVDGRGPVITDGSWWPTGSLFHGSVVAIGWPDVGWPAVEDGLLGASAGGPPTPDQTRVSFGTTPTDALGALMIGFLAAAAGTTDDSVLTEDRVLEAFQLGLLGEIDHPDGRARLDAGLHASGFKSAPGGQQAAQVPAPTPPAPPVTPPASTAAGAPRAPAHILARSTGADLASDLGRVEVGRLEDVLPPSSPPPAPTDDTVQRSLPRWFAAREPAVVVQGIKRSLKHGGDDRFTQDGTLVCRLGGFFVTSLSAAVGVGGARATFTADDLLQTPFDRRGTPAECADLVAETVLLDPGSARAAALHVAPEPAEEVVMAFMVEQTVWWALRDPLVDPAALLAHSGIGGTLPSPLAVTPPSAAWAPRHLEWTVELFPTPSGATDWSLGDIDLSLDAASVPAAAAGSGQVVSGRSLLTGGLAQAAASAGQQAIALGTLAGTAGVAPGDSSVFVPADATTGAGDAAGDVGASAGTQTIAEALVAALDGMDVLAGTLEGLHAALRGDPRDQAVGPPDPTPPAPRPDATGVVAGVYRPVRMRLVDAFGQVVDLLGSGSNQPADATLAARARTITVPGRANVVAAPPRFTAPGRVLLRFVDADPAAPATPLEQASETVRPVCGFVLPDHLDGTLQFFDATGAAMGSVEPSAEGDGRAVWFNAPGVPAAAGRLPSAVLTDPHLGALADALVRWGVTDAGRDGEGALAAVLRMIDSTLWTVDPFGHAGEEHMSVLVGHPVVVLRAMLRLDLDDPLQPRDSLTTPMAVRLGALAAWQDGLLGFMVDGEPDTIHATSPGALTMARELGPGQGYLGPVAGVPAFHAQFAADLAAGATPKSPVTHPFVSSDPLVHLWPDYPLGVTLLVVPQATVNATSGMLPRKELGVRRQWIADALATIAPSFRFGPVLVDPHTIRMPVATELPDTWSWNHRTDVTQWLDEPVTNATGDAIIAGSAAVAQEGWLTLHPQPTPPSS
jgi:hypothetical protein